MLHTHKKTLVFSVALILLTIAGTITALKITAQPQPVSSKTNAQTATSAVPDNSTIQKAAFYEQEADALSKNGNTAEAKHLLTQAKTIYQTLHQADAVARIDAKLATLDQQPIMPKAAPSPVLSTH